MADLEKIPLTIQQAVELVKGPRTHVHCFRNPGPGMIVGADWSWAEFMEFLRTAESIEVAGPTATSMKHGLTAKQKDGQAHFFETP